MSSLFHKLNGDTSDITVAFVEKKINVPSSKSGKDVMFSQSTKALRKSMNTALFPPFRGKY